MKIYEEMMEDEQAPNLSDLHVELSSRGNEVRVTLNPIRSRPLDHTTTHLNHRQQSNHTPVGREEIERFWRESSPLSVHSSCIGRANLFVWLEARRQRHSGLNHWCVTGLSSTCDRRIQNRSISLRRDWYVPCHYSFTLRFCWDWLNRVPAKSFALFAHKIDHSNLSQEPMQPTTPFIHHTKQKSPSTEALPYTFLNQ